MVTDGRFGGEKKGTKLWKDWEAHGRAFPRTGVGHAFNVTTSEKNQGKPASQSIDVLCPHRLKLSHPHTLEVHDPTVTPTPCGSCFSCTPLALVEVRHTSCWAAGPIHHRIHNCAQRHAVLSLYRKSRSTGTLPTKPRAPEWQKVAKAVHHH